MQGSSKRISIGKCFKGPIVFCTRSDQHQLQKSISLYMNRHVCTFNSDRRYWFEFGRISITKGFKEALGINLLRSQRAKFPVWYSELMDDVYFSRLLLALDAEWMKIDFQECRKVSRAYRRRFLSLLFELQRREIWTFRGIWIMHSVNALRKATKNQTMSGTRKFR